jgi:DNA-binding transcriptional LysR family regulator
MLTVTFRQLEVLVEVVRSGSFRRCGEKLGLSQVSVSEHIRSLEDRLGVSLFLRRPGSSPVLTDKGRIALVRAEQALAIVADLIAETSPTQGGRRLRVVVQPFLMGELPPVLDRFRSEHPEIALDVDTGAYSRDEIVDLIQRKEVDLAFFFGVADDVPAGARHVRTEPVTIFVAETHPLASRQSVTLAELATTPIVRLTDRSPLGVVVARVLAQAGIVQPPVALATDDFGLVVRGIRSGLGYACMFEATTDDFRRMGLARVDVQGTIPSLEVHMLTRPLLDRNEVVADLIRRMTEAWDRGQQPQPS